MSSDRSRVSSAADCRGKPQPIRSVGNSICSHSEQRGSKMFIKGLSSSRGCPLAAAALAAAAFAGLAGTASASMVAASTVYSENFGGSATGPLVGTAPTVDHGTSPTWISQYSSSATNTDWLANGTITGSLNGTGAGATGALEVAALNLTPVSGHIYTLSANLLPTGYIAGDNAHDGFVAVGFTSASGGVTPFFAGEGPWMLSEFTGSQSAPANTVQGFFGTGTNNGTTVSPNPAALGDTSMVVLNTTQSQWVGTEYYNNSLVASFTYGSGTNPANPTGITQVAIGVNGMSGSVTNFSLTDQAVPEPATLGLVAVGSLGLLLLKRRKAV